MQAKWLGVCVLDFHVQSHSAICQVNILFLICLLFVSSRNLQIFFFFNLACFNRCDYPFLLQLSSTKWTVFVLFGILPSTHAGDSNLSKSLKMLWNFSIKAPRCENPQTMLVDSLSPCLACTANRALTQHFLYLESDGAEALRTPNTLCFSLPPPLLLRVQRGFWRFTWLASSLMLAHHCLPLQTYQMPHGCVSCLVSLLVRITLLEAMFL